MSADFQVPDGAAQYIDRITKRCDSLIRSHIWAGVDRNNLSNWIKSFKGADEEYLSAIILDNLIFRSEQQTKALMVQVIQKIIPQLLQSIPYFNSYNGKWMETLSKPKIPARIVPVIRESDGPCKSGNHIAREYSRLVKVNQRLIVNPQDIEAAKKDGVKLIIFIDDFLGTGKQFNKFFNEVKDVFDDSITAVYTPLAAHSEGLKSVKENAPNLLLGTAEKLTYSDGLFSQPDGMLADGVNTQHTLKEYYMELARKRLGDKFKGLDGYGNLNLLYGFSHATPNATLPILWAEANNNKTLLVRR